MEGSRFLSLEPSQLIIKHGYSDICTSTYVRGVCVVLVGIDAIALFDAMTALAVKKGLGCSDAVLLYTSCS